MPFKHDDEYLIDESFIIYIMDNCSSACIPHCMGKVVVEVGVGNNERDCCDECNKCSCKDTDDTESVHISKDRNGNPIGCSKTWSTTKDGVNCYSSYSHYNSDINMLRNIASDFGVRL